jgi:hypothetical protein
LFALRGYLIELALALFEIFLQSAAQLHGLPRINLSNSQQNAHSSDRLHTHVAPHKFSFQENALGEPIFSSGNIVTGEYTNHAESLSRKMKRLHNNFMVPADFGRPAHN